MGGSILNGYYSTTGSGGWGLSAQQRFLEVDVVPEVPMTGMVMGIGALAIAAGHTLRRKLCAAKSV
jgi:hypothetical protein